MLHGPHRPLAALSITIVVVFSLALWRAAFSLSTPHAFTHSGHHLLSQPPPIRAVAIRPVLRKGPPTIALTFDDGPNPYYTLQVLALLRHYHIHATFFVIGRQAAAYPSLVTAEVADGNEVENHTWDHADLTRLSPDQAASEVARTATEVLLLTGRAPRYLRPPYGGVDSAVHVDAASMGEDTVLWNVDPRDWSLPSTWYIQYNVLQNTRDHSIILLHDGGGRRDETLAALQTIIPTLKKRGYQFVTVQELLDPLAPTPFSVGKLRTEGPLGSP